MTQHEAPPSNDLEALAAIARALCEIDGVDPDEDIHAGQAGCFENYGPRWQADERSEGMLGVTDYKGNARTILTALRTIAHAPQAAEPVKHAFMAGFDAGRASCDNEFPAEAHSKPLALELYLCSLTDRNLTHPLPTDDDSAAPSDKDANND